MPYVLRGHILQLCGLMLLISACSGAEEATTSPIEDLEPSGVTTARLYDQQDGDIYLYVADLSEEGKAQGESSAVFSIRYLGAVGAAERIEMVDDNGGRIAMLECSNPCVVAKFLYEDGSVAREALKPSSILAAAFQDVFNGHLTPTQSTESANPALPLRNTVSERLSEASTIATPSDEAQSIQVYRGKTIYPDFAGREKDYAFYRSKIVEGMKSGPDFAGRYAIIVIGCGTGCKWVTAADVSTGQLFNFPYGGEDDQQLDLTYSVKSSDITARWIGDEGCMEDFLSWDGAYFVSRGARRLGYSSTCDG